MSKSILIDFWTDKDLRTDDTILRLLKLLIRYGALFIPDKYYLDQVTRNRTLIFRIPDYFEKVKEATKIYDVYTMFFLRGDTTLLEIHRRAYDGINPYGRPADPNCISIEQESSFFEDENFCQKFLEIGKVIYTITKPHYGFGHDSSDSVSKEIHDQDAWLETNRRKEICMVYWANFLGPQIVENYGGKEKLLNSPCWITEELLDGGVLLVLSPCPLNPASKVNREKQNKVLDYLGLPRIGKRIKERKQPPF